MKKIAAVLFLLAAVGPAFAQTGGNDWKDTGVRSHIVLDGSDGVDRWFKIQYNTTTLTRRDYGWMFVYDVVFDDKSPTLFNVLKLNCKEDLYNMAAFNTQNNTAHAVLGEFGGWKKIPPKSAVLDLETFFCK